DDPFPDGHDDLGGGEPRGAADETQNRNGPAARGFQSGTHPRSGRTNSPHHEHGYGGRHGDGRDGSGESCRNHKRGQDRDSAESLSGNRSEDRRTEKTRGY